MNKEKNSFLCSGKYNMCFASVNCHSWSCTFNTLHDILCKWWLVSVSVIW